MNCECGRIAERNGRCATCNFEDRRAERRELKEANKKPSKIPRRTKKRESQEREYSKLRKQYLEYYPCCEVIGCHQKATEIHHKAGREGHRLTETDNFLAVCKACHGRITINSAWAIKEGYSILRTKTTTE